jgi:iron complex transport system substrate-binding protein
MTINSRACTLLLVLLLLAGPLRAAPLPPQRITDAWYAHNAVLVMLGAADRVVATVVRPGAQPWMYRIAPALHRAESIDGATMNAEELLRLHSDLVFVTREDPTAPALQRAGLRVVPVGFNSFDGLLGSIDATAGLLETPLAAQRAQAYRSYLAQQLSALDKAYGHTPESMRPRVLHIESLKPLKIDGADTIIEQWIRAAGGRNAADGLRGNQQPVAIEQVLAWNPDLIIIGAGAGSPDELKRDPLWRQLPAVRGARVYGNPAGVFSWDRYGPELALQLDWAAQVIHGGQVDEAAMVEKTRRFYREFFAYALSGDEARRMLAGAGPFPAMGITAPAK